jgi:hypothetical protein
MAEPTHAVVRCKSNQFTYRLHKAIEALEAMGEGAQDLTNKPSPLLPTGSSL